MTASDDSVQRMTDQFSSSALTVSKTSTGDHSECPECNGEYESCQHWTQVGRSFSSRHGQRRKNKNLHNGPVEDVRTVPARPAREQIAPQRPTNGEPHAKLGPRGPSDFNSGNNRTRSERTVTHVVELSKINRSDASSPSPSAPSPDVKTDYDPYDNRSFHRYSMRSRRSFRSGNPHNDPGEPVSNTQNTNPTSTDVNDPAPNTRPPLNRVSSNTSQSSGAQSNYRNGPGENWRRPMNGNFRRSHHAMSYGSRNHNPPYRPNGFARNRGSRTAETGDSHNQQQHRNSTDSSTETPIVVSPTKPQATSTQETKTSWAAAVAAPIKVGMDKHNEPPNVNHQQLVNFLVSQWHSFHRKS